MSYFPQRTFNGVPGEPSTDLGGPDELEKNIDDINAMFNPNATHSDGVTPGGITQENMASGVMSAVNITIEAITGLIGNTVQAVVQSLKNLVDSNKASSDAALANRYTKAEVDAMIAGSGVSSFNGRSGAVTPQNGDYTAAQVGALPSGNVSGTSGYLAKFTGSKNIANGPQLGSDTTKFLRNDGQWAVPPGSGGGGGGDTNKVDGISGETITRYGVCSTAATTAAKAVSVSSGTFTLEAGATVTVKFNNTNSANTPTLNVNSTGAKNIYHKGAQITSGDNKSLLAGVCSFVYDGTQWHLTGNYIDTNTTYESKAAASGGSAVSLVTTGEKYTWNNKLGSHQTIKQEGITGATINRFGTCSTAGGTAAKTVAITTGTFALEAGSRVSVKFSNANTASNPTLNVASKGAKSIYHKGSQITTGANKALLAGVCDFIYDGTQWHLVGNYIDTNTTYSVVSTSGNGLAPTLPGDTTKFLNGNGAWTVPPNTTTGTTYAAASVPANTNLGTNGSIKNVYDATKHTTATVTLAAANWSSNSITVSVSGVTASNTVIVSPAPASLAAWSAAGVYCSAQASGQLTFTCATTPTVALTANIIIMS